jgi:16S rRNA (cytosine967-C5)-methyltransferase
MNTLPPARLQTQADVSASACAAILWAALGLGRPADRALAALLRDQRQLGSRDRRLISETTFIVLRWWGWIGALAPTGFRTAVAARQQGQGSEEPPHTHPAAWAPALGAAWVLEGGEVPPAARLWLGTALPQATAVTAADPGMPLPRRAALLAPFFPPGEAAAGLPGLVPEWAFAEIDCPRPVEELLEWLQRRPPVWMRAQTTATDALVDELRAAGVEVQPHPRLRRALHTPPPRVNLRTLEAFRSGRIEVQDLASQLIGHVCAPRPGQRWWDACAGAGGKTLHLADLMAGKGSVTASDIRAYKLDDLRRRARRGAFPNIRIREWKGKALPERKGNFDGVLVDAPCSCSGTWRRNPDARWTLRQAELAEFAELQGRLLANASSAVRPGGVLVYATCSMFRRENRAVVEAFLAQDPAFRLEPFASPLSGESSDGTLQAWPWDGDCDAMFTARLRRQG